MAGQDENRPGPTVESLLVDLVAGCDGARNRDGSGFNKGDQGDAHRLAAMVKRGIAWSSADLQRALELLSKYARQAAMIATGGRSRNAPAIEGMIRRGQIPHNAADPSAKIRNMIALSQGGTQVHFWMLTWLDDHKAFIEDIKGLGTIMHGVRRCRTTFDKKVDLHINKKAMKAARWTVDLNGSTRSRIVTIGQRYGFLIPPVLLSEVDPVDDQLGRSERFVRLREATRDGHRALWAVFDLHRAFQPFGAEVKANFKAKWSCDPTDDWNWYLEVTPVTAGHIGRIIGRFSFAADPDDLIRLRDIAETGSERRRDPLMGD
jgi:hypothetical protein